MRTVTKNRLGRASVRGVNRAAPKRGSTRLRSALALTVAVVSTVALAVPAGADVDNTRVDAPGTVVLAGAGWLDGNGVDIRSNGRDPGATHGLSTVGGVTAGYKWQCVEMINRLYLTRGWITSAWPGNGFELYDTAPGHLAKSAQGTIEHLSPGDVVVLADGGLGHAGVVNNVVGSDPAQVQLVNQNTESVYSDATWSNGTLTMVGWAGYSVTGVVHAPGGGSSGGGTATRLVGDFNGDDLDDAAVMYAQSGDAFVALSTGSGFGYPGQWSSGHSVGAESYLTGDVDGDGQSDLVAMLSGGNWKVSLSSGSGFWPPSDWAAGQHTGADELFLADVNGDGMDDIVSFSGNGTWLVSTSSGSGFWPPTAWRSGHGVGSTDQAVGDFTGDGRADAGVYFAADGKWFVGASTGSAFGYPGEWSFGHGAGSSRRLTGDANGDGRDDIVYFAASDGRVHVGASAGGGFWTPAEWAFGHGPNTADQFTADVTGDGKADLVTFDSGSGDWSVSVSSGGGFWTPTTWIAGHGAGS
ncbi:MAG: FG-GAP-like repeat-containing protein [Actinomycetota bacterium]|nr:FG-GAP-like repeat-containing protein [Actinomycetota bacterium]